MAGRTHTVIALIFCAAFGLPTAGAAASLSPLGDTMGLDLALPGTGPVPGIATPSRVPDLNAPTGTTRAPAPFKFVDDTGLDANPLRSILPENQWANPQAAQNGLIQRR